MNSVNFGLYNYLDYFACPLIIAQKIYFDFKGRKLFIDSVINSVILVSLSIIHRHVPSGFSDYFVFTVCEIHFSGFIEAFYSKGILDTLKEVLRKLHNALTLQVSLSLRDR